VFGKQLGGGIARMAENVDKDFKESYSYEGSSSLIFSISYSYRKM
jgi:hypothetical protein